MIPDHIIQEQLGRKSDQRERLREVQRYYSNAGREREFLNSRHRFDKASFREVLVDQGGVCNGFIEALHISGGRDILLNIALKGKYKTDDVFVSIFNRLLEDDQLSLKNHFYTFVHIGDTNLEFILDAIGFRRVVDRPSLTRIQAPLDGYHLTYMFEKTATVTNRPTMIAQRKPLPIHSPVRTGDKKQEGHFDPLKRLQELKEKRK